MPNIRATGLPAAPEESDDALSENTCGVRAGCGAGVMLELGAGASARAVADIEIAPNDVCACGVSLLYMAM